MFSFPTSSRNREYRSSGDTVSSNSSIGSSSSTEDAGQLALFSFIVPTHHTKGQHYLRATLAGNIHFRDGYLLSSKENCVMYPVVHFTENNETVQRLQAGQLLDEQALGSDFVLHQGLYREVRSIIPETELPPPPQNHVAYMLLGFKNLDRNFSQVMLDTWKDWTGARHIYMYLPDELGLTRISFYHREAPHSLSLFMYLVLVECQGITSKEQQVQLMDFAQRMRVERMAGSVSVYSAESLSRSPVTTSPVSSNSMGHILSNLHDTHISNNYKHTSTRWFHASPE
ncbi:uncharacterized protein [Periplaneta americana]|uniref:uncharacterized protein isoform X2 n=1 Tax=Periplaneta americana TaxID=6978 RepID=UPI0037E91BBD